MAPNLPSKIRIAPGAALAACLACMTLLAAAPRAAEDYSQWAHFQDLYLNTSASGANVAGTVTRFPLLIRLDASNFDFSQARSDGKDLRFTKASSGAPGGRAPLPFQVERWDLAKSRAEIWVRVDTVKGNDDQQNIRLHWGNAAAPDAPSAGAVFDSADGYLNVYHMGAGNGSRANSVAGFEAATTITFDGNEIREGMIGPCDSLGTDQYTEDHLQMSDPLNRISEGFTFSAWTYPVDLGKDAALLSIGNGAGLDNVHIKRGATTTNLILDVYLNSAKSTPLVATNVLLVNQWQHVAVTIDGLAAKVYRNGLLAGSVTLTQPASPNRKAYNYIGKSSWYADAPFAGKLDEVHLSRKARSADWIKLSHASQSASPTLVVFEKPAPGCVAAFGAPKDTVLLEGSYLELAGKADCATAYTWTAVSGPAPRLFDPDVKTLPLTIPRVTRDTSFILRFSGTFPDSVRNREVRITIKEGVPDPIFALPASLSWNGKDSLLVKPQVTNMDAIRGSRDSVLNYSWRTAGLTADTAWRAEGLLLVKTEEEGDLTLTLCLDNGGAASCKDLVVQVSKSVGVRPISVQDARDAGPLHDARGRMLPDLGRGPLPPVKTFPRRTSDGSAR